MSQDEVSIEQETRVSIPEHQILLSFNGDEQAVKFYEWWNRLGSKAFIKWFNTEN